MGGREGRREGGRGEGERERGREGKEGGWAGWQAGWLIQCCAGRLEDYHNLLLNQLPGSNQMCLFRS